MTNWKLARTIPHHQGLPNSNPEARPMAGYCYPTCQIVVLPVGIWEIVYEEVVSEPDCEFDRVVESLPKKGKSLTMHD